MLETHIKVNLPIVGDLVYIDTDTSLSIKTVFEQTFVDANGDDPNQAKVKLTKDGTSRFVILEVRTS